MNAKSISFIIDAVAAVIVLISFLWGLKRGLKKSVNRLLLIIICLAIALIFAPVITNLVMSMNLLPIDGKIYSINSYISSFLATQNLNATVTLADFTLTVAVVIELIKGIANLIVFVLLFIALKFITWIIYLIIMREPKISKAEKEQMQLAGISTKKYHWWGSLVGAVQGIVLFICFFIPLSGISSLIADINTTANASTQSNSSIIADFVPNEYQSYLNVYENTFFNKVVGWTKIDEGMFDSLTTSKINGTKVSLRKEVNSINKLYIGINKTGLIDAYRNGTLSSKINSLSEEETSDILTNTFSNTTNFAILKFALVDSSNVGAKALNVKQSLTVKDIDWEEENQKLSGALTDMIYSLKPIMDDALENQLNSSNLEDKIVDIEFSKFGRGMDKLRDLELLKNLYQPMFSKLLDLSGIYSLGDEVGFDFRKINITTVKWEKEIGTFGDALKLSVTLKNKASLDNITGQDIKEILTNMKGSQVGDEFDKLIAQSLKEIYDVNIPDDFSIIDNVDLIDTTSDMVDHLQNTQTGEALTSEKSSSILETFEEIPETTSTQAILDAFSKEANITENKPTVSSVKTSAELMNKFITCEDSENQTNALALANELNSNPNIINLLKLKSNTYLINQEKYDAINTATAEMANKTAIMSLFTVIPL